MYFFNAKFDSSCREDEEYGELIARLQKCQGKPIYLILRQNILPSHDTIGIFRQD